MIKRTVAFLFFIATVMGQSSPQPPPDDLEQSDKSSQGERIKMMKMWRMTEALDLSEDQAQKFFPKYNTMVREIGELKKQQKDQIAKLREMVEDEQSIREKDVNLTINKVLDLEKEKLNNKQKFIEDLGNILTPAQTARYVVFEVHFKEELRRSIREHRKSRSEKGKRSYKRKRDKNW